MRNYFILLFKSSKKLKHFTVSKCTSFQIGPNEILLRSYFHWGEKMKLLLALILITINTPSFANNQCNNIEKIEHRIKRLQLKLEDLKESCDEVGVKCNTRGYYGLSAAEAVKSCESIYSRSSCIATLSCEGTQVSKCKTRGYYGLSAAEAVKSCENIYSRSTCIATLSCENKKNKICKSRGYYGLSAEEAVESCENIYSRSTCAADLSCEYK